MYYNDPNGHYDETALHFSFEHLHDMHNKVVPRAGSLVHFIDPDFSDLNAESQMIVSHFDTKTLTVYGVDERMRCRTIPFDILSWG